MSLLCLSREEKIKFRSFFTKNTIQQLCQEGKDWDEKLPAELSTKFHQWLSKATKVPNIEIERCYTKNKEIKETLLVGFCDASKIGYAACIYLCAKCTDESRSIKMIATKTRVGPLTNQIIPRLELLGALILSRLMKKQLKERCSNSQPSPQRSTLQFHRWSSYGKRLQIKNASSSSKTE